MHPTVFALKRAYQATQKTLDEELEPFGLTAAQLDVLMALDEPPHLEQRTLQEALGISSATLTRLLEAIEREGFIRRTQSPDDARVNVVVLTDSGDSLLRTLEEEEERFNELFFQGLSHTDVARLTRLLNRIAENMGDTSHDIYQ